MASALTSFLEQKFKERRNENYKYTVKEFAQHLGIKRENLAGYMNPKLNREPRIGHCAQMAKALGIPLIDFLVNIGLLSKSEAAQAKGFPGPSTEGLPEVFRAAMATPEWAELFNYSDEIEMLSTMPGLTDAASVIQAIRDLPIFKIKALFQKYHSTRKVQEDCYRHCAIIVKDWSEAAMDRGL